MYNTCVTCCALGNTCWCKELTLVIRFVYCAMLASFKSYLSYFIMSAHTTCLPLVDNNTVGIDRLTERMTIMYVCSHSLVYYTVHQMTHVHRISWCGYSMTWYIHMYDYEIFHARRSHMVYNSCHTNRLHHSFNNTNTTHITATFANSMHCGRECSVNTYN